MARIHAERAATPAERALWRSVLDRLSAAAAVVTLLVLAVHTGAHEALLTALSPIAITLPSIHYAKSDICAALARLRWIWLWINACLPNRSPSQTEPTVPVGEQCPNSCAADLQMRSDEPCGTDRPLARLASSRWSRSLWWILANGETATSAEQPVAVPALRDKALSVGAMPLHANHLHALWTTLSQ
nr:DUF3693 domain-containing protein [Xanthomonas vasicola]